MASNSAKKSSPNNLISGLFRVDKLLGAGSFGQIRLGENVTTGQPVAIKFESKKTNDPQLYEESQTYKNLQGKVGFPIIYYYGDFKDSRVLVMQLLDRNLGQLIDSSGGKLSLKFTLYVTLQVLERLEVLHSCGIIYRDLKPDNIMNGVETNLLYLVDFGLSTKYQNSNGHIPNGANAEICGTPLFMSIHSHKGMVTSRRDDIESLSYLSVFCFKGTLPWFGLSSKSTNEALLNKRICNKKELANSESLCCKMPAEFGQFFNYSKNLQFEQQPNYDKIRKLFLRLFERNEFANDGNYDWNKKAK